MDSTVVVGLSAQGLLDLGEEEDELKNGEEDELEENSLIQLSQSLWRAINRARLVGAFLTCCETSETNPVRFRFWQELCDLSLSAFDVSWADWLPSPESPSESFEV